MKTLANRAMALMAFAVLAMVVLPAGLDAQQPQQQLPDAPDQEELIEFTEAYIEVTEVRMAMEERIANAETAEEAGQIQQRGNEQMVRTLEENGFTTERYGEIVTLLNVDEELREEFERLHEEILEDRGGVL